MDLSSQLLQMIHTVSQAPDVRTASVNLLGPLLGFLQMDQGVFCEVVKDEVNPIFAMDKTRQILKKDDVWLSSSLIGEALQTREPVVHIQEEVAEGSLPSSVQRHSLRFVVVLPVNENPRQVVHLASRLPPSRVFSQSEFEALKIATKAAVLALEQQRSFSKLKEENQGLIAKLQGAERKFLYASTRMEELVSQLNRVARFNISILLQGESGSGKEEVAQLIHQLSGRKGKFVAVNCANLTENLLESELFGHTKGAFTGAIQLKPGMLVEANEGTFFLDEVGELPLGLQAKLLRVLQERCVRPLGSNRDVAIDVRFLAASHKDLWTLVQEKRFREDLYYRLQELVISVPPLRERQKDVLLLAEYFIKAFSKEFGLQQRTLGESAQQKLLAYSWPGNVRELKNACKMAVVLSNESVLEGSNFRLNGGELLPANSLPIKEREKDVVISPQLDGEDLSFQIRIDSQQEVCLRTVMEDLEKQIIHSLLEQKGATQALVAKQLGISIRTLQRSLQ